MGEVVASTALAGISAAAWAVTAPAVASAAPENRPHVATATRSGPTDEAQRTAGDSTASRSHTRATPAPGSPTAGQHPPAAPAPTKPAPVAGLSPTAMDNAVAVIEAGRELNLPKRAFLVAITTTLQESQLRNLANTGVPESMNRPNEGAGHDYDSVGIFQQRVSMGWGSLDQLMNPKESARSFYSRLVTIGGWEQLEVGAAAQAVQQSAFPGAYSQHQVRAQQIVDAIV
jgi:hypothetical protein